MELVDVSDNKKVKYELASSNPEEELSVTVDNEAVGDIELNSLESPTKGYDRIAGSIRASSQKKTPQNIMWSNVNFNIKGTDILVNCWGEVSAGKTCAIMGPSGAGKSSLLNVLAGRSASAPGIKISGKFSVGGKAINPVAFRKNIAYVMQEDALLATATPREALIFSAKLRLPPDTSMETIHELVEAMLEELGLEDCANTMIGGPLIKGISGGQKKRTSVGVEIITNPSLLFLDEPTSGLDSYSAFNCVSLLKKVASNSRTAVLCTIHQPSSEVFFLFDQIIFLKNGRIFYQGPVDQVTSYFGKFDYVCPNNYNPSDYVMFINQTESMEVLESKGVFMTNAPATLTHELEKIDNLSELQEGIIEARSTYWTQFVWLLKRELLNTRRDVAAIGSRFFITIFLNLLYGLIFFNAAGKNDSDPTNFNSHFGAMTMITISSMFGSAQPVMLQFPFERPMFLREYSTGTYSGIPYFVSKLIIELPVTMLQTLAAYILVYFLVNMQGPFFQLVAINWGLGVASASVAVLLGCAVSDVKDVTELSPLLFVPQLLFAGFFVRTSQIPVYLRWAQYLCGMKYAMNLILITEFNPSLPSCDGLAQPQCQGVLSNNNVVESRWWIYMLLLMVLFVAFRVGGALILIEKAKRFY